MRFVALFLGRSFITRFWTTYRLPFQSHVTITYPPSVEAPEKCVGVLEHEMIHVAQFVRFGGPLAMIALATLVPLPIVFSGRCFIERRAYLHDIRTGRIPLERAVDVLWRDYGFAWPRPLMRRWFERQLMSSPRLNAVDAR